MANFSKIKMFGTPYVLKDPNAVPKTREIAGLSLEDDITKVEMQNALEIEPLPPVTQEDNGKFMRVINGVWAADTVPSAEASSF